MNLSIPALSIACLTAVSGAFAGEMKAECPIGIPPTSIKVGEPVQGWVTTPKQMHLRGAGMMMAGPETAMYVDPIAGTKEKQVFEFEKDEGQRWLWCGYGGVQLTRRLDDRARRCILVTKTQRRDGAPTLTAMVECE